MATLEDKIKQYKDQGLSAIEIQQRLRDQGLQVPWLEVKSIYNRLLTR